LDVSQGVKLCSFPGVALTNVVGRGIWENNRPNVHLTYVIAVCTSTAC